MRITQAELDEINRRLAVVIAEDKWRETEARRMIIESYKDGLKQWAVSIDGGNDDGK